MLVTKIKNGETVYIRNYDDLIRCLRENVSAELADKTDEFYEDMKWERDYENEELKNKIEKLQDEVRELKERIEDYATK